MIDFLSSTLPFWKSLTDKEKKMVVDHCITQSFSEKTILYHGGAECSGLEIVKSGRVRAYITSEDGREITLYRLLEGDICIMSAACMLKNLDLGISLEIEKDSEIVIIPRNVYKILTTENTKVKDFTLQMVSEKFSDVMWVFTNFVFSSLGKRLAAVLVEHSALENSLSLNITHEDLARDLGTAREVVTRLLKQFALDGYVILSRGKIEISNLQVLKKYN